jgi:aminoglycoside phosphotransferase (APT) family kinase protein
MGRSPIQSVAPPRPRRPPGPRSPIQSATTPRNSVDGGGACRSNDLIMNSADKMHADEVDIDADLVAQLVVEQFPELADQPIRPVQSTGTVNAIYRIGDDLCARLPRVGSWAGDLKNEAHWLPMLAPHLSLRVPVPVATGQPGNGYPFGWAVYEWIDGQPYADELVDDERQAARDLAQFVAELRAIVPVDTAPRGGRRPLVEQDASTREAIDLSRDVIDRDAATAAWDRALEAPVWQGKPVWIHADLLRPNLLVQGGRLAAVIDFGAVGVGDPAADVIAAWSVFNAAGRDEFRAALDVDDGTWLRAQGFALLQAAMIIPYYGETNPGFVALAKRTFEQIIADSTTT